MAAGKKFVELHLIKFNLFKSQNTENGRFDVTFEIEGKLLYAHKNMLNLVSDTFDSMLSDRWTTNKDESIKIKDYSHDDFFQFLTFLYTAQCELSDSNIYTMVDIAEFYGVQLFKDYCEEYLAALEVTTNNIFKLMELAEKYSMVQLKASVHDFIANNFQSFSDSDGLLKLEKCAMEELVIVVKDKVEPKDMFQALYKWTEKQAMEKQFANSNLSLNDTIKAEIADFLPQINFNEMELRFMVEFLIPRGFIFSSLNELSKIISNRLPPPSVKITNVHGQTLQGNLIFDKTLVETIKSLKRFTFYACHDYMFCWWDTRYTLPSTPSSLKKKAGIEWYLIYDRDGDIGVRYCSEIRESDYLLVELTRGTSEFDSVQGCKIKIE